MSFKTTVREWFRTDDRPDEDQFNNWFNWTRWNDEKIPLADIEGIDEMLNDKADREAFETHLTDADAHAELFAEPTSRIAALEAKTDSDNNWKTITGYSLNPATRVLTMDAGWEGIINGIDYTNVVAVPLPAITLAAAGYSRIDLIVFNTAETFVIVPGIETVNTPVKPAKPTNTLEATFVTVSDGVVNVPVIPKPKAPVTSVNGMRGDVVLNAINDLVTGGIYSFLSAEQGKVLKTQVDAINTLLGSDDVNLDTVQEIVTAIKTVQTSLSTILVNDLTTGGTTKALTAEMGKTLKGLIDSLTTNKVDKVAGERLINAAEITKLAGVTNVTTTVKTITSASLATQDVAGFVAYINALAVVLVVGANEIVEYQLSDTGRLFKLLLRGRSFGVGQAAIVAADVEEVTLWMGKDIKLSNYPNTRSDGQLPTNKVLSTDVNGNLKMYTIATAPAPFLSDLIPDSYAPSNTGNFVIKGAFFTPTMTVVVQGQTVNYLTFISDNEVRANITTGATEGTFDVTLNNGLQTVISKRFLVVLGTVYKPTSVDWVNKSSQLNVTEDGTTKIGIFNTYQTATWSKVIDYTKNFRVQFYFKRSPLGSSTAINEFTNPHLSLNKSSDNSVLFYWSTKSESVGLTKAGSGSVANGYQDGGLINFNPQNESEYLTYENALFEFRYVSGVMYIYVNNVIKRTFTDTVTENLKLNIKLKTFDIVGIRYIETT